MRAPIVIALAAIALSVSGCKKNIPARDGSGVDSEGMSATGRSTSEQPEGRSGEGTAPGPAELHAEADDGGARPIAELFKHTENRI